MSEWCIIQTCPCGKLLIYASGSQANISARQCTVLFKYMCLDSPSMVLSTQHCINCTGIQSSRLFGASLGKSKFCCSEEGRPPLLQEWEIWKKGLHWSCSHIAVTVASPALSPPSATAPAAAANLDCPAHGRQNPGCFTSLAVCCSRQLPAQPVPQGGFASLSKVSCILHFYWIPGDGHWPKGKSKAGLVCQMCKLYLRKEGSSWHAPTPGNDAVLHCSMLRPLLNCTL